MLIIFNIIHFWSLVRIALHAESPFYFSTVMFYTSFLCLLKFEFIFQVPIFYPEHYNYNLCKFKQLFDFMLVSIQINVHLKLAFVIFTVRE